MRVPQVDDLVELEPERLHQVERASQIQAPGPEVGLEVRVEVLVGAAWREGGGVRLEVEQDEEEPKGLDRLVEGVGTAVRKLGADARHLAQVGGFGGSGIRGHG